MDDGSEGSRTGQSDRKAMRNPVGLEAGEVTEEASHLSPKEPVWRRAIETRWADSADLPRVEIGLYRFE